MSVTCTLCFHHCRLEEGQTGLCRARANRGGVLQPLNYGRLTALALDPIEKKPLRRFHPGSLILSVGSFGCNLHCPFCQNAGIAAAGAESPTRDCTPRQLAEEALRLRPRGNIGVAYTYNEPLVGYEFVRDCAEEVRRAGLCNVLVTNGTLEEQPWRALLPLLDAVNIDLKGFTEGWYRRLGGDLETVKRSIVLAASCCHPEVTTLVVPGENDSEEEMRALSAWLASVRPDIPLHVSRFFPRHRMQDRPPTPVQTVYRLAEVAREQLSYVYTGNC
ncbi:AmmeMemoRadiSam system radical SAM enzyme [Subdoligranulum variabile]|uniref:Radical SAM domain protein n=1 Tax=Subdoligranulum variabile DSM 15176 TaxID=411471 RepID=D1PQU4_9FIRM|nr:AmmeMemoRadiSam system radical SAM enzyme [Subdoligranulum variabile]EFB74959.1 radical SAM domain protein [Subdoligranulum variabile DSM 15176]UWP67119.1 AmmeMemoRadiSam system radical SAM enzyme [Subdoligranulum variabile]